MAIGYNQIAEWLRRGIAIQNLKGHDGLVADALTNGLKILSVGIIAAALVETAVVQVFVQNLTTGQYIGYPLFAALLVLNASLFGLVLFFALWIFRTEPNSRAVSFLTCCVFSGLIPLVMLLSTEQMAEAIRLFAHYRDPGKPYLKEAYINLLLPEQPAGTFATVRIWCFLALQLFIIWWYLFKHLRRTLIESLVPAKGLSLKVTAALALALIADAVFVHFYFGRAYWIIMATLRQAET